MTAPAAGMPGTLVMPAGMIATQTSMQGNVAGKHCMVHGIAIQNHLIGVEYLIHLNLIYLRYCFRLP